MLQLPFTIDPQVNGHVTLKTGAPISKEALIPALEAALEVNGTALLFDHGTYDVVPMTEAQKRGSQVRVGGSNASAAGFGVEIVPLRYIAAEEMQKVLSPLTPEGAVVRADDGRNLLFITGTEPQRASLRDTVAMFDVDYFRSMSFALIQPVHVDAGTLASELEKIFDNTGSPIAGLVKLIPISRINSLLVATPRASYLHELNRWVTRLDVPSAGAGRHLYYYHLQNSRAKDVTETLAQLFGGSPATYAAAPAQGMAPGITMNGMQPPTAGMAQRFGTPYAYNGQQPPGMPATAYPSAEPEMQNYPGAVSAGRANGPQIVMDEANNALIIRADQMEYESIAKIIQQMDVTPDQVLIEATIAEITLNDQLKFGVEWAFKNHGNQAYALSSDGTVKTSFPGFAFSYVVPNVQVALSALGTKTKVSVLSSPKILTLDNRPASLQVGDQVPIVTQTSVDVISPGAPIVSSVSMKDTGVILSVTPRISKSGMVLLDVSQEVSDVVPTTTSGIDSPTIQQRKLQSTVGVSDGQTIALGGLIRQARSHGDGGIPFLKDIPLFGRLVRSNSDSRDRTELLVFLTPHVIRNPADAQDMTDQLAHALGDVKAMVDNLKRDRPQPHKQ